MYRRCAGTPIGARERPFLPEVFPPVPAWFLHRVPEFRRSSRCAARRILYSASVLVLFELGDIRRPRVSDIHSDVVGRRLGRTSRILEVLKSQLVADAAWHLGGSDRSHLRSNDLRPRVLDTAASRCARLPNRIGRRSGWHAALHCNCSPAYYSGYRPTLPGSVSFHALAHARSSSVRAGCAVGCFAECLDAGTAKSPT